MMSILFDNHLSNPIFIQQCSSSSVSSTKLLVAAIDFGTTYSSWAFSFKHWYESDSTRISSKQWYGGQNVSLKVNIKLIHVLHYFGHLPQTGHSPLNTSTNHSLLGYHQNSGLVVSMCY